MNMGIKQQSEDGVTDYSGVSKMSICKKYIMRIILTHSSQTAVQSGSIPNAVLWTPCRALATYK